MLRHFSSMPAAISALPQIAFSKNPIPVTLTSADYLAVTGQAAVCRIFFKGAVTAGFQIQLLWPGANVTMTCATTPDDSGNQFPAGDGLTAYVTALVAVFNANYYINRDFVASYALVHNPLGFGNFDTIILTARDAINGSLYNIAPVAGDTVQVAPSLTGFNQVQKSNFAHHLEVWLKGTPDVKIYDNNLQLDYPVSGVTTKDISNILNPYLQQASDKPDPAAITWQLCPNSLKAYYLKYGQYFDDTPTVKKIATTAPAFVNIGGLSVQAAVGQTMAGYLSTLCLRQGSKLKLFQANQPEWLYWINLTGADIGIKVNVVINYTDLTTSSFTYATQTALAWQKYYVAVGYNQINLASHLTAGKTFAYYSVSVVSSTGSALSSTYTYVPDAYRDYPRYFVYLNSLGGFQTLYTFGKAQDATDRTKTDIRKQVTYAIAAQSGMLAETDIRLQNKTTVNTGYNFRRSIALLKDFLVSTEKYYYFKGKLIPIGISSNTLTQAMDGTYLNAGAFEFYPLYDNVVFTDDASQPDDQNISGYEPPTYIINCGGPGDAYDTIYSANI